MRMDDCFGGADRISDLPNNLIENILVRVPLLDAVRTSVLSTKWRYKWVSLPKLVFDANFIIRFLPGKPRPTSEKLMLDISQILMVHRGPLVSFSLSIPELQSCPEIDRIIIFLSGKDIQNLHLQFLKGENHVISSCLFVCRKLRSLQLSHCVLKPPPSFEGFCRLTHVNFEWVEFDGDINIFIQQCPLLERLRLHNCTNLEVIDIDAPNLKFLNFNCDVQSIYFKNTPLLEVVHIYICFFSDPKQPRISNFIKVFSGLPALKDLFTDALFLEYLSVGGIPHKLPCSLDHLECLLLYDMRLDGINMLSCALCLIRSCPNLQKLCIELNDPAVDADITQLLPLLEAKGLADDFSLNQLHRVEINRMNGTRPQLEFVKLLLAKASRLEKMVIRHPTGLDAHEVIKFLKEMIQFQRASTKAEIVCLESNEWNFAPG